MAHICGLKIGKISIKGTATYRGVMQTEPRAREVTNPSEALREISVSLSGFIGEVMITGKYTIYRNHPDLTGAIQLVEDLMNFDDRFKNIITNLSMTNPGTYTEIENPQIRACIERELQLCLRALTPHKPAIKLIAETLLEKEELNGDEFVTLFSSVKESS